MLFWLGQIQVWDSQNDWIRFCFICQKIKCDPQHWLYTEILSTVKIDCDDWGLLYMINSQLLPIEVSSCNVLVALYHYSCSYFPSPLYLTTWMTALKKWVCKSNSKSERDKKRDIKKLIKNVVSCSVIDRQLCHLTR